MIDAGVLGTVSGGVALLAVVGVVLLTVRARRRARRRRAALRRWADANGWVVASDPVVDWGSRLPGGDTHGVSVALSGSMSGRPVGVGEYAFTESATIRRPDGGHGTRRSTHEYVVVVVRLDPPSAYLGVQPCEVLARWGRTVLGVGSPIGDGRFDERLRIVGDPAVAAYRLPDALVAAHVDGTVPPWTLYGSELMTWYPGRIDPARVREAVEPLLRVADLLTAGAAP
jgi:hypothetical protein